MYRIARMLWFLSVIAFLAAFLFIYAYLPLRVAIGADVRGIPDQFVTREAFFYFGIAFFLFTNIILIAFANIVPTSKTRSTRVAQLRQSLSNWLRGLAIFINLFFISAAAFIAVYNNAQNFKVADYVWLVYIGPVLIIAWLVYLAVLIGRSATQPHS